MTKPQTFYAIKSLLETARESFKNEGNISPLSGLVCFPTVIVCNKCDLPSQLVTPAIVEVCASSLLYFQRHIFLCSGFMY